MTTVTFFGHADALKDIRLLLEKAIIDLIENYEARIFYVGNQGSFDRLVLNVLRCLKLDYPNIVYAVVLPYCTIKKKDWNDYDADYAKDSIYPEGLEKVPRRFAIIERNRWMIKQSDIVITYVKHIESGAAIAKEIAEKAKKRVINIPEITNFSTN